MRFDKSQLAAVRASHEHVVSLFQGPPGIGETAVVKICCVPRMRVCHGALMRHARTPGVVLGRYGNPDTIEDEAKPYSLVLKAEG